MSSPDIIVVFLDFGTFLARNLVLELEPISHSICERTKKSRAPHFEAHVRVQNDFINEIKKTRVEMTIIEGRIAFQAKAPAEISK